LVHLVARSKAAETAALQIRAMPNGRGWPMREKSA